MNYLLKPLLWNTRGYAGPAGVKAARKSFPGRYGFGYEEWNNSPRMLSRDRSTRYFHTEPVGDVTGINGQIVVFMYASHDRVQELVGVAGKATLLTNANERRQARKEIDIQALADEAWGSSSVQSAFGNKRSDFDKLWKDNLAFIPAWRCPADHFMWLRRPARLDAPTLTRKSQLLQMFTRYTALSAEQAARVLGSIPNDQRDKKWRRLNDFILFDLSADEVIVDEDIENIQNDTRIPPTSKKALIDARLGQGKFRRDLEIRWQNACAVSGCGVLQLLRASHIKPWRDSSNSERLNPENGLLLVATLDAAFDRGLISFKDDGDMLVSSRLPRPELKKLGVPSKLLAAPSLAQQRFLAFHRKRWGFP